MRMSSFFMQARRKKGLTYSKHKLLLTPNQRLVYSKCHVQKEIRRWMMKSTMHPCLFTFPPWQHSTHVLQSTSCEDSTDTLCTLIMYWKLLNYIRPGIPDVKVLITLAETDSSFTITILLLHAMWANPQKHNKHKLLPYVNVLFLLVTWLVFSHSCSASKLCLCRHLIWLQTWGRKYAWRE